MRLIRQIEDWADARNLIEGSTAQKQLKKLREEVEELAVEIEAGDIGKAKLELGDVAVVLIIQACQMGLLFEDCLEAAYEKIKDRKGRMVDGVFIKESDNK